MATEAQITDIQQKLMLHLLTVKLGVAGQLVYYDDELKLFILSVHSTGPEKTEQAAQLA